MNNIEFTLKLPNGPRLAGKRWGPIENIDQKYDQEKVLALHGWLDNASTWDGLAPELAKKDMVVICLDFLGHGKSDHQQDADYSIVSHVMTIIHAIDVIGWKSFILMGHSMGAAVSTLVAAAVPTLVKSLILVEGIGEWPTRLNALETLQKGINMRSKLFFDRQPKVYPDIKSAINKLRENNPTLAQHSASFIVRRSLVKVQDGFSFSHDPRLVARPLSRFTEESTWSMISGIRCPVLIIWTQKTLQSYAQYQIKETKTTKDIFEERMSLLNPQCTTIVTLEEGSHHVHLDNPEAVLEHVVKFLGIEPQAKL